MKRHLAIREFIKLLNDDDIIVASGKTICNEAYQFDRPLLFYIEDESIAHSIALGMSNGTNRRVFIFCSGDTIQEDLEFLLQLGISKKSTIYYVLFKTEGDSLIDESRSLVGFLYNLGPEVYNYTQHFSKVANVPKIQGHVKVLKGPATIFINVSPSNIEGSFVETDYTNIKDIING